MSLSQEIEYIVQVQSVLRRSEIFYVLFFLESYPIIYQIMISSFNYSRAPIQDFINSKLDYIFYPKAIVDNLPSHFIFYFDILIFVLLAFLFLYKHLLISFIKKNSVNSVIVGFYEIFFLRMFGIVFINILAKGIFDEDMTLNIISIFVLGLFLMGSIFHFKSLEMYLNFNFNQAYPFNSHLIVLYDIIHLALKVFICFASNIPGKKDKIRILLDCVIIGLNIFTLLGLSFLLVKERFTYFLNQRLFILNYFGNGFACIISVSILMLSKIDKVFFGLLIINGAILSFFLTWFVNFISICKIFKPGNEMQSLLYLINSNLSKKEKEALVDQIIVHHNTNCTDRKNCTFCQTMAKKKEDQTTPTTTTDTGVPIEFFIKFYFKEFVQKKYSRKYTKEKVKEKEATMCYLIYMYISYYSGNKNIISSSIKFHKILKLKRQAARGKYTNFLKNFTLNLSMLYHQMTKSNLENKNEYYTKMDSILLTITSYLRKLKDFFSIDIKTPTEVFSLSGALAELKRKVDINFIISKENKFNYQCIIAEYALETIFNSKMNKTFYITEIIHTLDDFMHFRFNNDKIILSHYNLLRNLIQIRVCGKDLIKLQGKNFGWLFPSFIYKEGMKRTFQCLTSKKKDQFDFYFLQRENECIEPILFNFTYLPTLKKNDMNELYLLSNYKIKKDKILIFKKTKPNVNFQKVLVGVSSTASKFLHITPEIINSVDSHNEILLTDFIKEEELEAQKNEARVNIGKLNKKLKKIGIKKNPFSGSECFSLELKEKINWQYETYVFKERSKCRKDVTLTLADTEKNEDSDNSNSDLEINFKNANSGMSSSCFTNSSISAYTNHVTEVKNERNTKFKQFYQYSYYIMFFDGVILIIIISFFVIEISNNASLDNLFSIITNFNNFQFYFYHASLSIFSLSCNSDTVEQIDCVNQFTKISEDFINQNPGVLTSKEMLSGYVSGELEYKAGFVLETLTRWNNDKEKMTQKEITDISSEKFEFYTISEVSGVVQTTVNYLSFSDAVKNYVNLISLLSVSDEFLVSPVFIITIDGKDMNDLTNIVKDKAPINGSYLNDSQRYYYIMLMNFQKYIRKLLKICDLLTQVYQDKISSTNKIILVFILLFLSMHLIMMIFAFNFSLKFKNLHKSYYFMIYEKLSDKEGIKYYTNKMNAVNEMLSLYHSSPISQVTKIDKLRKAEAHRKSAILKGKKTEDIPKESKLNEELINKIYCKFLLVTYVLKIFISFMGYIILCILFFVIILSGLNKMSLMNKYAKLNYDLTNYSYINFCLTQLMSLTNQTDTEMYNYFNSDTTSLADGSETSGENKFVSLKIQDVLDTNKQMLQMEKKYSFFSSLTQMLDIDCDTMYKDINDRIIRYTTSGNPDNNYLQLLSSYCKTFDSINYYKDDKLSVDIISYQTDKLLNSFRGRQFEDLAAINNSDLLYQIYLELLLIMRPLRRYTYNYLSNNVISKIISSFGNLIIGFIFFNFAYDILLFLFLKFKIINDIVEKSKEIIALALSFECF